MNIALIGNQNCGKTTLFNRLTGSRQKVGNFPGVTVDVASGPLRGKKGFTIVDLPGVYSLSPYSNEEKVTRDYLFKSRPDCVINILDATNLNRNLYLTMQVLETQTPTIVALNMMDDVKANGMVIDIEKLSEYLGVVVVPISAAKNQGIEELIEHCVKVCLAKEKNTFKDRCEGPIHTAIHSISHLVETNAAKAGLPAKFSAIRIIENDAEIIEELRLAPNQVEIINHFVEDLEKALGTDR
ncbi:MAG TPA: FeoB small GTPase domain-containing protein, partial [Clostridia bacterium]|nr:FeoB small GTPase domain-containing protein [Clostridia bacterium]